MNEALRTGRYERVAEVYGHLDEAALRARADDVIKRSFPDMRYALVRAAREGELIVVYWTATATHEGPYLGHEATHKTVVFRGSNVYRFHDGKIKQGWSSVDRDILDQIRGPGAASNLEQAELLIGRIRDGDMSVVASVFSDPVGADRLRANIELARGLFPDVQLGEASFEEAGDKVVVSWIATATHEKPLLGFAPTGKRITIQGGNILRFRGGKVVEDWFRFDKTALLSQLAPER